MPTINLRDYQTEARKICNKCKQPKELICFGYEKKSKDGLRGTCKDCRKIETADRKERQHEINKNYYQNNKEKEALRRKKYYKENKEIQIEKAKLRYRKNQDERIEYSREYRKNNKHKVSIALKNWRQKNKSYVKKYSKEYKLKNRKNINEQNRNYIAERIKKDDEFKIKEIIRSRFRNAIRGKGWREKFLLTGYRYSDYISHFEKLHPGLFIKYKETKKYHIDHIIPIALYDHKNSEEIKKCWHPKNMRIISAFENNSKKDKLDFKLVKEYGIEHLLPEGISCPI